MSRSSLAVVVSIGVGLAGCGGGGASGGGAGGAGGGGGGAAAFKVFANNDLGMHCVDRSFAVFSILPPYNVVDAQVVALQSTGQPGRPRLDQGRRPLLGHRRRDRLDQLHQPRTRATSGSTSSRSTARRYRRARGSRGCGCRRTLRATAGTRSAGTPGMGLFKAPGHPHLPRGRRRPGEPLPAHAVLRLRQVRDAARLHRRGPAGLRGDLVPELPRHRQGRGAGRRPGLVERSRSRGPGAEERPHPAQRAGPGRTSRLRSSARAATTRPRSTWPGRALPPSSRSTGPCPRSCTPSTPARWPG